MEEEKQIEKEKGGRRKREGYGEGKKGESWCGQSRGLGGGGGWKREGGRRRRVRVLRAVVVGEKEG